MRLDKYLADMSLGTRSEVKDYIKKGLVTINGEIIKKADFKVNDNDEVLFDGERINYVEYEYYMLNKPAGYLSATEDRYDPVVMELVNSKRKDLAPIGRLDKDTEGLLLISNDGDLNHKILSPKNHIPKKYYVEVDIKLPLDSKEKMAKPMDLGDFTTKPAIFEQISDTTCFLTITEGKFHQVKRMFENIGCTVTYLKRVSFGPLVLDDNLPLGNCRHLTQNELIELLKLK